MNTFEDFNIKKQLRKAIDDLGFEKPTPIQQESYSTILGGGDFVGIAQTGTGKTIAYLLPVLQDLKFSDQLQPRVLILAPTRELVIQIVEQVEILTRTTHAPTHTHTHTHTHRVSRKRFQGLYKSLKISIYLDFSKR